MPQQNADAPPVRPDQIIQGILLIVGSVIAMAFSDAMVKRISDDLSLWQIFVARGLFAVPLLFGLARANGIPLRPTAMGWVAARSALLVLTWLAFYASLPLLNFSVAAVAVYTNPIMIALLAAMVLGEQVTKRQWIGVVLGFAGVMAIIQPGGETFDWAVLLPLLAALFYAMAMVLTRSKCRDEVPLALAFWLHGSFIATGLIAMNVLALWGGDVAMRDTYPFLLNIWSTMDAQAWGVMALLGVLSAAYFAGVARAYQIAPPQIIATFDYGYLVSAALWGFVFFQETPDLPTLIGMVLITCAGLLVARR